MTLREFITPDGKWNDKAWLYDRVLVFITHMTAFERSYRAVIRPRSEREIYSKFAPLSGRAFAKTRSSWNRKNRKVKRQMLAAVLRRLVADGKIRVDSEDYPDNRKSMHGLIVSQRKSNIHLFGADYDGVVRTYVETNALQAIADALTSPLLNNNDINGARSVLLNITSGSSEITMDEISEVTDYVVSAATRDTTLIWGMGNDESLGDQISVTIIATGFKMNSIPELYVGKKQKHFVPLRDPGKDSQRRKPQSNVVPHQKALEFDVKEGENAEEYILMSQSKESTPEDKEKTRKQWIKKDSDGRIYESFRRRR